MCSGRLIPQWAGPRSLDCGLFIVAREAAVGSSRYLKLFRHAPQRASSRDVGSRRSDVLRSNFAFVTTFCDGRL